MTWQVAFQKTPWHRTARRLWTKLIHNSTESAWYVSCCIIIQPTGMQLALVSAQEEGRCSSWVQPMLSDLLVLTKLAICPRKAVLVQLQILLHMHACCQLQPLRNAAAFVLPAC